MVVMLLLSLFVVVVGVGSDGCGGCWGREYLGQPPGLSSARLGIAADLALLAAQAGPLGFGGLLP